jgi:hypothetical protein
MKKTACTILCFLHLISLLNAQDWAPIRLDDKHHFVAQEEELTLINTIWIDSVTVIDGDSLFHFNTIAKIDDCSDPYYCPVDLKAQQFLQTSMTKLAGSGRYTFSGEHPFVIEAQFPLGGMWFFEAGVTAFVDGIGEAMIYGQQDSIKIITLTNDESFILSKSFGLLNFPAYWEEREYEAIGLQESQVGITIPDFLDYHNFEVGDVFQYRSFSGAYMSEPTTTEDIDKYTILSKEVIGDSLFRYEARRVGQRTVTVIMPVVTQELDTVTWEFINSPDHPTNQFSGTASGFGDIVGQDLQSEIDFGILNCYLTEEGKVIKIIGERDEDGDLSVPLFKVSENNPDSAYTTGPEVYFEQYDETCGMTAMGMAYFEVGQSRTLMGYIKDGVQVGEITPDDIILPNEEVFAEVPKIWLSPNPTSDVLNVRSNTSQLSNQLLRIFNNKGQIVYQETIPALTTEMSIDVSHLPKGEYFLSIGGSKTQVFIRQ